MKFLGSILKETTASNVTSTTATCSALAGCAERYLSLFNASFSPRAMANDLQASILDLGSSYCGAHELYKEIPALEQEVAVRSQEAIIFRNLGCPCNIEKVFPRGQHPGAFQINVTVSGFQGSGIEGLQCAFGDVSVPATGYDSFVTCSSVPVQPDGATSVAIKILGPTFTLSKSSGNQQTFYYIPAPSLTVIKPKAVIADVGLSAGRRSVTLTGASFTKAYGGMTVRFGCDVSSSVVVAVVTRESCDFEELNCTQAVIAAPEQDAGKMGPNGDGTVELYISVNGAYYEPACPSFVKILRYAKPAIASMTPLEGSPTGLDGERNEMSISLLLTGMPSLEYEDSQLYCVFGQFTIEADPSQGTLVCKLPKHTVQWDSTWLIAGELQVAVVLPGGIAYTNNSKAFNYIFQDYDLAQGLACPPQTFGNGVLCVPCPLNTFMPLFGYPECFPCPNSSTALGNSSSCACSGGGYEGEIKARGDTCKACIAGYASGLDAIACTECPPNTYSGPAAAVCTPCPLGATSANRSTSVSACSCGPTQYLKGDLCCNKGEFLDPTNNMCTRCPAGTYENQTHCAVRLASHSFHIVAPPAPSFLGMLSTCRVAFSRPHPLCSFVSSSSLFPRILILSVLSYPHPPCSLGPLLPPGSAANPRCTYQVCPAGTSAVAGSTACAPCPINTFAWVGQSACTPCPEHAASAVSSRTLLNCSCPSPYVDTSNRQNLTRASADTYSLRVRDGTTNAIAVTPTAKFCDLCPVASYRSSTTVGACASHSCLQTRKICSHRWRVTCHFNDLARV